MSVLDLGVDTNVPLLKFYNLKGIFWFKRFFSKTKDFKGFQLN